MMRTLLAAALLVPFLASAAPATPDTAADGAAIRALEARWNAMIAARDLDGVAKLYADDGGMMPPGAPRASGPAIRETWQKLFATPGFKLVITPVDVQVAAAGDMAMDRGTYTLSSAAGPDEHGKYVVVWKKVNGEWRVLADIFNADAAAR